MKLPVHVLKKTYEISVEKRETCVDVHVWLSKDKCRTRLKMPRDRGAILFLAQELMKAAEEIPA